MPLSSFEILASDLLDLSFVVCNIDTLYPKPRLSQFPFFKSSCVVFYHTVGSSSAPARLSRWIHLGPFPCTSHTGGSDATRDHPGFSVRLNVTCHANSVAIQRRREQSLL